MTKKVDGDGFDKDEFSPEERAKVRAWLHYLGDEFLSAEEFLKQTGLTGIVKVAQAMPVIVKLLTGAAVIGAAMAWVSAQGWI